MKSCSPATWASLLCVAGAAAQPCEPGWAPGFASDPGLNGEVCGIVYISEGGTNVPYAAGSFSRGVARWVGGSWQPVGTPPAVGLNGGASTIAVLDVGSGAAVYVGGGFTSVNGAPANRIARWDGHEWSALGAGFNSDVLSVTAYDDGAGRAIFASGKFGMSGETVVTGIARWTGSAWAPVGGGLGGDGAVGNTLTVLDKGDGPKLYVGGFFEQSTSTGLSRNIACWDGKAWTGFGPGVYTRTKYNFVMPVCLFDYGAGPQLTIGGSFSLAPEAAGAPRVARWTGSTWMKVGSDLGQPGEEFVQSLIEHDGPAGKTLYAAGAFSTAVWLNSANYIARLGAGDWVGLENGTSYWVRSMTVHHDPQGDRLLACGLFTSAGSALANKIAEWDGTRWNAPFDRGRSLSGPALAATVFDDGSGDRLYVGGQFVSAGVRIVNNIATWDGAAWETVGGGVRDVSTQAAAVNALAAYTDAGGTGLYAAGRFVLAGLGPCLNIARWDGDQWSSLAGSGPGGVVNCLATCGGNPGPGLYVGGNFAAAGGQPAQGVARWDGTQWSAVGSGLLGSVNALLTVESAAGTVIYAGGAFSGDPPTTRVGVARWDGNTWSNIGELATSTAAVHSLAMVQGKLVAGGLFGTMSGTPASHAAQWDGTSWLPLAPAGTPYGPLSSVEGVRALLSSGQSLWLGGRFVSGGPAGAGYGLLRWDGGWSPVIPGVSSSTSTVRTLATWNRGGSASVFVGGSFSTIGGVPSGNFAEYRLCVCAPDCNQDNVLTTADFGCFQTRFALGDPYADCNGDGLRNIADFGCFQTKFALGCP